MAIDRGGRREFAKLLFDMVKHCSTISTVALLIMAVFMENLLKNRESVAPIATAAWAFVISTITGLFLMLLIATLNPRSNLDQENRPVALTAVVLLVVVLASFGTAISNLAQFIAVNFRSQ